MKKFLRLLSINQVEITFQVGKTLGQGTFGTVRLAIHTPTGEKVAIKTLEKYKIIEQADIQRVTREICILKILRHPNIIQLYEIIETKKDIHLIMEYAQGGQLFDHIIKKKRLDEKETVRYTQQILSGIQYLQKNGIVHRDLKPQNLLFDGEMNIKIVDFGLSNQYKPGEKLKTACGSPCYAAPEMLAGESYDCSGIDIWSCGIIIYAMLCGYLPFEDQNTMDLYKKIMIGDFQQPKYLSNDSKHILKHILNVNPANRYKIQQIKQTRWYNQIQSNQLASGLVMGKDVIEVDQEIISKMKNMDQPLDQIRNYVLNNKHNQITSFYYLLKKKLDRQKPKDHINNKDQYKHQLKNSPIFHPQKKLFFASPKNQSKDFTKRDDSLNATYIISSLKEANKTQSTSPTIKNRPAPKYTHFYEPVLFKKFPKKINQYSSNSPQKPKSVSFKKNEEEIHSIIPVNYNQKEYTKSSKPIYIHSKKSQQNTKRQIHQQIKFIKTNNNYQEIRNQYSPNKYHNLSNNVMNNKIRQNKISPWNSSQNRSIPKQIPEIQLSQISNQRLKTDSLYQTRRMYPCIHSGPFNANCLFKENPNLLMAKIIKYLSLVKIPFSESQLFSINLSEYEIISVQSLNGLPNYILVKFTNNSPLIESIIQFLHN